jgi:hypothetical protein
MKTYTYEGREYVESGEIRRPKKGEVFLYSVGSSIGVAQFDFRDQQVKILIPKEERVESEEYNIPVLVKVFSERPPEGCWAPDGKMDSYGGRVILCRAWHGEFAGPHNSTNPTTPNPSYQPEGWHWHGSHVIPYPTREQIEAEQAKLKPKADSLPAPVRAALDAADLGCRRDGVEKLVEAIFASLSKATA